MARHRCVSLRALRRGFDLDHPASYRRTEKRVQARAHLTTAPTMYREMNMRFWREPAEAESRELDA